MAGSLQRPHSFALAIVAGCSLLSSSSLPCMTQAFVVQPTQHSAPPQRLFLSEDSNDPNALFGGDILTPKDEDPPLPMPLFSIAYSDQDTFYKSLQDRSEQLSKGIGKRYVVRTQKGFLNVHRQPTTAYDTTNIAGSLVDGDVVVSTGPPRGEWIQHDGGKAHRLQQKLRLQQQMGPQEDEEQKTGSDGDKADEPNDGWSISIHGGFTWLDEIKE